jgi:ABC-type branched-subunit amino acid transport system substrate-binding protein
MRRRTIVGAVPALLFPSIVQAAKEEIKIGNTMPYSGPVSMTGVIGNTQAAYFQMLNERGGISGHPIKYITLDDAYLPSKAVENVRRLIEQDRVNMLFSPVGTACTNATIKYINQRKVPHLFVISGASRFSDPAVYPYTITGMVPYEDEARIYAKFFDQQRPNAKIAVLYQNDDLGKDYLAGLTSFYGLQFNSRVLTASYEVSDPTIDSQIINLKATGAEVLFIAGTPRFASQAIRKAYDLDWKPLITLNLPSSSIVATLQPAGFEKSIGVVAGVYLKDPGDPALESDPGLRAYREFVAKHVPSANPSDSFVEAGYMLANLLEHVLQQCGTDFSRENVMRQAVSIRDLRLPILTPGIAVNTSPTNHRPLTQLKLRRWNGRSFDDVSGVISGTDQ